MNLESQRKYLWYVREAAKNSAGGLDKWIVVPELNGSSSLELRGILLSQVAKILEGSRTPQPKPFSTLEHLVELASDLVSWSSLCARFVHRETSDLERALFEHRESEYSDEYGEQYRFKYLLRQGIRQPSNRDSDTLRIFQMAMSRNPEAGYNFDSPEHVNEYLGVFLLPEDNFRHLDRTRLLCTTTDGHFGWIPEESQAHDYVCLLAGFPAPFIVRQTDDGYYAIIGDAYVQGIMRGQAWLSRHASKTIAFK